MRYVLWRSLKNRFKYNLNVRHHGVSNVGVKNVDSDSKVKSYLDRLYSGGDALPADVEATVVKRLLEDRNEMLTCIKHLDELTGEKDSELEAGVKEERDLYNSRLMDIENELLDALLPDDLEETIASSNEAILEVSPGVGGQEAMLFASELLDMYLGYCEFKGWDCSVADDDRTEIGGLRHGSLLLEGRNVFSRLKWETGVHRVQRVPATEKSGRVHTSTATVAVLPQPRPIHVNVKDSDIVIETKRASGAGGQHVNTTDSAVRLTHTPSGIVVDCQTSRSQIKNREMAMKRLKAELFQKRLKEDMSKVSNMRRLQVGSSARSDKIRTYNYNQDRITDHRLSASYHNIKGFLSGESLLDKVGDDLRSHDRNARLQLFLDSLPPAEK